VWTGAAEVEQESGSAGRLDRSARGPQVREPGLAPVRALDSEQEARARGAELVAREVEPVAPAAEREPRQALPARVHRAAAKDSRQPDLEQWRPPKS